jgi:hypothetical protein
LEKTNNPLIEIQVGKFKFEKPTIAEVDSRRVTFWMSYEWMSYEWMSYEWMRFLDESKTIKCEYINYKSKRQAFCMTDLRQVKVVNSPLILGVMGKE